MARVRGSFNIDANYDSSVKKPFDARMLVPTYADLTKSDNWYKFDPETQTLTSTLIAYNGMIVAVADKEDAEHNGIYLLMDYVSKKNPVVTDINNWIKIGDLSSVEERLSALEAIELPEGVTIEQVQAEVNVLREELTSAGYLTTDDLAEYALKTEVADAVADSKAYTDEALNDYVTSDVFTEEVSKLVTDQELEDAIKAIDYSTYATKEEVNAKLDASVYNTDKDTFALKADLSYDKIENTPDLSVYAKATDLEGKAAAEHKHTLADIEDYAAPDLGEYALKSDIPTDYVTQESFSELSEAVNDKASKGTTLASYGITDAYTAAQVDAKIAKAVTEGKVDLDGYVTTTDLAEVTENIDAVSTKAEANEAQIALINPALNELRGAITYGEF